MVVVDTRFEIPLPWANNLKNYLREVYVAKNHDYGNSAYDTYCYYGDVAILIRVEDKLRRLETLRKQTAHVKDESIKDTYCDAINYMIILAGCRNTKDSGSNFDAVLDEFDEIFDGFGGYTIVGSDDNYDTVDYLRQHFHHKIIKPSIDKYEEYIVNLIRSYYTWCIREEEKMNGKTDQET